MHRALLGGTLAALRNAANGVSLAGRLMNDSHPVARGRPKITVRVVFVSDDRSLRLLPGCVFDLGVLDPCTGRGRGCREVDVGEISYSLGPIGYWT